MTHETDHERSQDRLIEYLYGEIAPEEKVAFKNLLGKDPQLSGDLKSFLQLRRLIQEHLPEEKAPRFLSNKVLRELGLKTPWYVGFMHHYWQPALAGALVLMLTLGISYTWKRVEQGVAPQVADVRGVVQPVVVPVVTPRVIDGRSVQEIGDSFLVNASASPQLRVPLRRGFSANPFANQSPQVTLAGYGQPYGQPMMEGSGGIPADEVQNLQMEADMSMAQLHHQQALRLRGMGEFKAAADDLGRLVKEYPFYPLKYQAMAQRVDCLFRAGEANLAKQELRVLQTISPNLAYLLEQRWNQASTQQ